VNGTESELIARAVALGEHGRRSAPPNPWVGCVIVDDRGAVAGEGWHQRPGTPHAEVHALAAAGHRARCRTGRAWCLVKTAMSLDARVSAADGSSRWITGTAARADAHRLRAESQAVVVGASTALADHPSLTARDVDPPVEHQPLRVLLDGRGRVPAEGPLFDTALAPTLVVTTDAAPAVRVDGWRAAGAKVETVPPAPGGVDLEATLDLLGQREVLQAMVEGGPTVHGALLAAGLVDRLVAYVAPTTLGPRARAAFPEPDPDTLADARRWRLLSTTSLGDDVRLEYELEDS
jgi:diaminohydroxyphosphoribosylaminopyrimidine deaminase/5-amino-6-(5-phosphoribosylamino)uracil reductase